MTKKKVEVIHYGHAGHFICADRCLFHLCTKVGRYLVSSVGSYRSTDLSPQPEEIGSGRTYETLVFELNGEECPCGCSQPQHNGMELDGDGYTDAYSANLGHAAMCEKWEREQQ